LQSVLPAAQAQAHIESALSNIGLDTLQNMREGSPTGGALGQVPIQQQKRLEQVLGSLKLSQKKEVVEANLKRVMNIYMDIVYGTTDEIEKLVGKELPNGEILTRQKADQLIQRYDLPFDIRGRSKKITGTSSIDIDSLKPIKTTTGAWEIMKKKYSPATLRKWYGGNN
jgi:hypothetical protein